MRLFTISKMNFECFCVFLSAVYLFSPSQMPQNLLRDPYVDYIDHTVLSQTLSRHFVFFLKEKSTHLFRYIFQEIMASFITETTMYNPFFCSWNPVTRGKIRNPKIGHSLTFVHSSFQSKRLLCRVNFTCVFTVAHKFCCELILFCRQIICLAVS